jgi:hypothetical protein
MRPENRRKLKLLRRHHAVGFAAVVLSKLVPVSLLSGLLALRAHHTQRARGAAKAFRAGYKMGPQ